MTLAIVFPGQGSQSVGMLAGLAAADKDVRTCFDAASEVLGYDLWALTQNGPESELARTEVTQPAMLTAGYATWVAWRNAGGPLPQLLAGHSLGEYTALVAAGALAFADAVRLVAERGRLMQEAVPRGQGAMAAIMGLQAEALEAICAAAAGDECVSCANYNAPGQIVIAGSGAAVERAIEAARAAGAKRAVPLPVSAPFHCALMQPAADALRVQLRECTIAAPAIPVVHNIDAATRTDPDALRDALYEQAFGPVRWTDCIEAMAAAGITQVAELGPGKVLAGLTRRIDKGLTSLSVAGPDSLGAAVAEVNNVA